MSGPQQTSNVESASNVAPQSMFSLEEVSATLQLQMQSQFDAIYTQMQQFSSSLKEEVIAMIKDKPSQAPNDAIPPPEAREVNISTGTAGGAFLGSR